MERGYRCGDRKREYDHQFSCGGCSAAREGVQKMVEKLDAGDVLLSEATPIGVRETAATLHDRLSAMGAPLVLRAIEGLVSGALKGVPQDESKVTIAKKLTKELQWLDPESCDAETLDRQVRALSPWPGTRITIEGLGSVKILEAEKVDFQGVKAGEIDSFRIAGFRIQPLKLLCELLRDRDLRFVLGHAFQGP
jgi:methionyl-tRNA formyltransferase